MLNRLGLLLGREHTGASWTAATEAAMVRRGLVTITKEPYVGRDGHQYVRDVKKVTEKGRLIAARQGWKLEDETSGG